MNHRAYFFFPAAAAGAALAVTALITPTATVCFISLTANLPNGGNFANSSTHNGFVGTTLTSAESPFLMNSGFASDSLPVLLSSFESFEFTCNV